MKLITAAYLALILLSSCDTLQKGPPNKKALTNEQLLDTVQYYSFQYFWDGAEPVSGAARERFHEDNIYPSKDKNIVATGATGFGIMAIVSAVDRGFISRKEGTERLLKILHFLKTADRFHGAWPA